MSTTPPFILHIPLAVGVPDGLRIVERKNRKGIEGLRLNQWWDKLAKR